jgi:hypothetical protein
VHMIEEYARHNGHADLIRELIDLGRTGILERGELADVASSDDEERQPRRRRPGYVSSSATSGAVRMRRPICRPGIVHGSADWRRASRPASTAKHQVAQCP